MIYIYDDRAQRRKDNEEKLCRFLDCLCFKTVYWIPGKSLKENIIDPIKNNAECIIFHKSYVFEDTSVTFEAIRDSFISSDIPIVVFSGGIEGSSKGMNIINVNADLMYKNLPFFLENYRENGKINIDTLLWGKRYKLNLLLQFQNKMAKEYFIENNFDDIIDNISYIKRGVTQSFRTIDKDIGESIIADIEKISQIKWSDLANIIDNHIKTIK